MEGQEKIQAEFDYIIYQYIVSCLLTLVLNLTFETQNIMYSQNLKLYVYEIQLQTRKDTYYKQQSVLI